LDELEGSGHSDIDSICEYFDAHSNQAADQWIDRLIASLDTLEVRPVDVR
jgi:hypothetical protein